MSANLADVYDPAGSSTISEEFGDPSQVSTSYQNSWEDIRMIRDLLHGVRAVRAMGQLYLPKFELESDDDYTNRVAFAPLSNYFLNAHRNICSRPFGKKVILQGDVSKNIADFVQDVDGAGSSAHTFLRESFERGVAYGRHGIMIDYPPNDARTLAEEREQGLRPYWVHIPADRLIAYYTQFHAGKRIVVHARITEDTIVRKGFKEVHVKRVRVLDHDPRGVEGPVWALYEAQQGPNNKLVWTKIGGGKFSLNYLPMVVFNTGRDENNRIVPPLLDLANLQIEHYQQSSNLKNVLMLAGYPMLAGDGVQPPLKPDGTPDAVIVGPRAVLYAPPAPHGHASWRFIEPQGTSIQRVMENITRLESDMAQAGMQPLMRQSGTVTATGEAINAARAHATAEAWAMDLKDVAEQALAFTALWYGENDSPSVYIHTDFGLELKDTLDTQDLFMAHDKGVLSTFTMWDELKRRDFLGPQFDQDQEVQRIKDDPFPPQVIDPAAPPLQPKSVRWSRPTSE